ncbi:MAG: PorP/SprF family type IX secretion system membrane protein [Flavobacteriales bacterium]|nr:PorP/SprF family type IX secretion system membrane protein [Flavobacteriales bacterium]
MNLKLRYYFLPIFILSMLTATIVAQDVHFSQFINTPLLINPALTGVFNGDDRAILNYRNQWSSVGNPYVTSMVSYDKGFLKNKWNSMYLGAGIAIFNDKAGVTEFGITQVNLSISSVVALNDHHTASAGLQGGFAQRGISNTDVNWASQFNGSAYDPSINAGETNTINTAPFNYGDFAMGVTWSFSQKPSDMTSNDQIRLRAGAALFHVNKPKQQFHLDEVEQLYSKLVVHSKVYLGINNTNVALIPSVLYLQQKSAREVILGGMIRYELQEKSKYTGLLKGMALYLGGHVRLGDAFIPSVVMEISNYAIGFSYDVNVSGLTKATGGQGGYELSLSFINPNPFTYTRSIGGAMF